MGFFEQVTTSTTDITCPESWKGDVSSLKTGVPLSRQYYYDTLQRGPLPLDPKDAEGDDSSSDDESSSADSVFDTASTTSSQSSHYSASASTASEDAFDHVESVSTKHTYDTAPPFRPNNQHELLSGLKSSTVYCKESQLINAHHVTGLSGSTKCNRRRSGSYDSTNGPPCRLKRDTESTDCFVMLLISKSPTLLPLARD
jgi:hypothetical protein